MKTQLLFLICISFICISCGKKEREYGSETRPENFPEILVPLKDVTKIRYLSPETGKIVEGAYSISFWLNEEYPAKKMIQQIQRHLQSHGCVRVEGERTSHSVPLHVIEGEGFNKRVIDITEEFNENLEKTPRVIEIQWQKSNPQADYADIIQSTWAEEWITQDNGMISIVLQYYFPQKGNGDSQLWGHLVLFTPSSWMHPHVLRYKKNHPEQFQDPNEIEIKSPGG